MATATTTFAAIRSQMVTTVKAITPASLAGKSYTLTKHQTVGFRDWCEDHASKVLREYEIENISTERPNVEDLEVQLRITQCELVIAYPHMWAAYMTRASVTRWNEAAMRALIEEDLNLIAKAIGIRGSANYISGQHAAVEEEWEVEQGEGVSFGVLPLAVTYYHAA